MQSAIPTRGPAPVRVLFVCLGNICRSPTAEGVMRALVREAGLQARVELDSAGTGGWHVGSPPDSRAAAAAGARGIELGGRARSVTSADFERFDLMVAMDRSNASELRRLARDEEQRAKVRLLREFDPASAREGARAPEGASARARERASGARADLDVPDPYYGAAGGFEEVLDLVQAACAGLLARIEEGSLA
jgi:protein-tyrosine phosphatase